VLISMDDGEIVTYALGKLDDRGRMFVRPGDPVYEGMIVGIHSRDNDLVVNAVRTKQLTNFRVGQGRRDQDHAADRPDAGVRGGVHRGRRTGRDHAQEHPPAQALPEGARPQARLARSGVTTPGWSHGRAVTVMLAATLMWSIAGVVTRWLDGAGFEVTFWRSAANAVALVVLLSLGADRAGCGSSCARAAGRCGCPAPAGA
jgi:hypothetical protein